MQVGRILTATMAVYEYLCRACATRFEARRPMSEAGDPIECPEGHSDTVRLLSMFASVGASNARQPIPVPTAPTGGGCGAGCACAH